MEKSALREKRGSSLDPKINFLRGVSIFEDMSDEELEEVGKYLKPREFRKGEYIFFEEDPSEPGIFILSSGIVKLIKETQDGRTIIVRLVFPKDAFGWIEWGKTKPKSTYTAQSVLESTVYYIANQDFINLAIKYPAFAIKVSCDATTSLIQAYDILKSIASGRVEERIAKVLLEIAKRIGEEKDGKIVIEAPLTRQDIAEMTGTTVETAIRVMSKWKKSGIIHTERGYIEILKKRELERLMV